MASPVTVQWPLTNNPGSAPGEGSGRLINCYAYKDGQGVRWKRLPGLDAFASISGVMRGAIVNNGVAVAVVGKSVITIDASGNVNTLDGSVSGEGPVTIARNNNGTLPQVTISSSSTAYVIDGVVVRTYPDTDLPLVNSVAFLDGYFLWTTAQGQIWASGLNDEGVDALGVAKAEAKPDGLLRGVSYGQQFFAFGLNSIEVWQDVGASPFPLARSAVIPIGLFSQWAVAGGDDGWAGPLIFVAQDGSVRRLDGYTPTRISSEDLEKKIGQVAIKSDLRASVYTFGGNAIWSLSCADWTWEYNVTTGNWHERLSYGDTRWRGDQAVYAFGKWLVSDYAGGKVYAVNADTADEAGSYLIWGMDSGPTKNFPHRVAVPDAAFDFVQGQVPITGDPMVEISWAHDGGQTWANPLMRSIGKEGRMKGRAMVNRLGLSSPAGVKLRFRMSDTAYTSFAGAVIDASGRR